MPSLRPLERVILTDEVSRLLFSEYRSHRASTRGTEETGWILLGLREAETATVLATVPAGAERDAGDSHVQFNWVAQALCSRIIRQQARQVTMLGVVHTHPGSLRHPSRQDYDGDSEWVKSLRGGEGIFGIGTADALPSSQGLIAWQPEEHMQCLDRLRFSWYVLGVGDSNYRPVRVELTLGPDLALPLRPAWEELERHAARLDRLCQQLRDVRFAVLPGQKKTALVLTIPLPDEEQSVQVWMEDTEIRYLLMHPDGPCIADLDECRVDVGVFRMLAELAR